MKSERVPSELEASSEAGVGTGENQGDSALGERSDSVESSGNTGNSLEAGVAEQSNERATDGTGSSSSLSSSSGHERVAVDQFDTGSHAAISLSIDQDKKSALKGKLDEILQKEVLSRISENKRVRRNLDPWGRISVDRQLPFISIYRKRKGQHTSGDERLVAGEAAFITAPVGKGISSSMSQLVSDLSKLLSEKFGAFLIVEIWVTPFRITEDMPATGPRFNIYKPAKGYPQVETEALEKALKRIKIQSQPAKTAVISDKRPWPGDLPPLISSKEAKENKIYLLGLEVFDVYRDSETQQNFPLIRQKILRGVSRALKRLFFDFTQEHTSYRPANYQALGRRSLVKAVFEIDRQLAEISKSFDLVLAVTPTNARSAFEEFKSRRFESEPKFLYRPVAIEAAELKRQLYGIRMDRVEDPAMAQLFMAQQRGIDNQITLLADRGTRRFLYGSMQLYGVPSEEHVVIARHVLATVPARVKDSGKKGAQMISAEEFCRKGADELDYYREINPSFNSRVELRDDIAGVMVSDGNLLVSTHSKISRDRVYALLQHEVGTHIVTYFNGRSQPFQQLYTGLVGYDELQEGFAVLAEYLSGGLTPARLRMLAARVVAVKMRIEGATFVDTFRELVYRFRFQKYMAFSLVMRVFRGGGFTKDAVYLRGLIWLLDYLRTGGDVNLLLVGKMPKEQLPLVRELMWRKVIREPILLPRYLHSEDSIARLKQLREGMTVGDLSRQMTL